MLNSKNINCQYTVETWSLTLRDERRLRVFQNRVLRRVFGPKRDEVIGEYRKLHNEELNDLYSLPNTVNLIKPRRMRWAGNIARMGKRRGVYRFVLITNLTQFFNVFISLLYMFLAIQCSSSGESIVSIYHLVYVTLEISE